MLNCSADKPGFEEPEAALDSSELTDFSRESSPGSLPDLCPEQPSLATKQVAILSVVIKLLSPLVTYCLCLLPAHLDIDPIKVAGILGEYELPSQDELELAVGQKVPLDPTSTCLRKCVDQRVLDYDTVELCSVSSNPTTLPLRCFLSSIGPHEVVNICCDPIEHAQRLAFQHNITLHDARFLMENDALKVFEEMMVKHNCHPQYSVEWLRHLVRFASHKGRDWHVVGTPEWLADLVNWPAAKSRKTQLVVDSLISNRSLPVPEQPSDLVLDDLVRKVIEQNPKVYEEVQKRSSSVINFVIGKVMQSCNGICDPKLVKEKVTQMLRPQQ